MDKTSITQSIKNNRFFLIKMKQPKETYMIGRICGHFNDEIDYFCSGSWSNNINDGSTYSLEDAKVIFENLKNICQNRCKSRTPEVIIDQFEEAYVSSSLDQGDM